MNGPGDILPTLMAKQHYQAVPSKQYPYAAPTSSKTVLRNSTAKSKQRRSDKTMASFIHTTDLVANLKGSAVDKKSRTSIQVSKTSEPMQESLTKTTDHENDRDVSPSSVHNLKLNVKDIRQQPKPKPKKDSKERAYVSNYLDGPTTLTTGSRFSHVEKSAKTGKKQS